MSKRASNTSKIVVETRKEDTTVTQFPYSAQTLRTQTTSYFRLALRWVLPLLALLLIATVLVLSPLLATHAAGTHTATPTTPTQLAPHKPVPNFYRKGA
jgi:hypothetical protein